MNHVKMPPIEMKVIIKKNLTLYETKDLAHFFNQVLIHHQRPDFVHFIKMQ